MELATSLALGIGLSAACGFRVFVPLFIMSIAGLSGYLTLDGGFAWIATYPALASFGVATLVEVLGYYIPWVDNLLDTIATPAAVVAGIVASASVLGEATPLVQWMLAVIAGGGTAGLVQTGTVAARGTSSATTGGLGNVVVATLENVTSALTAVLALVMPVLTVLALVVLGVFIGRRIRRRRARRSSSAAGREEV